MTIEDGYRIGRAWVALEKAAGKKVIGHKIGLTSRAMQISSQIDEPDYGTLLDDMLYTAQAGEVLEIPVKNFIAPRVEVELAFVLKAPLAGPNVTVEDVLAATEYITPAIEIIDARIEQFDRHTKVMRKVYDTISDNAANAGIVIGAGDPAFKADPRTTNRPWCGAILRQNGAVEETGLAAGVQGDPAIGIAWLANKLAPWGERWKPARSCWPAASRGPWRPKPATCSRPTTARSVACASSSSDDRRPHGRRLPQTRPRQRRRMAGPRAAGRLLPHLCPPGLGRADLQPHLAARAGAGRALPHQPLRPALHRGHRVQPGQGRCRRPHHRQRRLAHQPGRLHLPRRHPRHPARRALRDARAHHADHGRVLPRRRPVVHQLLRRAALRPGGLPRLRGHHRAPRRGRAHPRQRGQGKRVLLLRNHGPVVIGHTLAQAFNIMWLVQRACEIQVASAALGELRPSEAVLQACVRDSLNFNPKFGAGEDSFAAMQRLIDRIDPGYRA
jgi:2-oxo-hept-3-ene-1,7-dioate hydratase